MRAHWVVGFGLMVAVGCGGSHKGPPSGDPSTGRDAYDSYPQLALIPAETPYALVTFKRVPVAMARRMYAAMAPLGRSRDKPPTGLGDKADAFRSALVDVVGKGLTPEKIAQLGLLEAPRVSLYGVEGYPVFRFEIAAGERVLAAVEDLAARAGFALPAPTRTGEISYWTYQQARIEVMLSVGPTEITASIAPPAVMARQRDVILGIAKPTASITPAVFRDLAATHGLAGHGVGFVDTSRLIHTFAPAPAIAGRCGAAIDELAAAVPRMTLGFDVGDNTFGYRAIVELSPPVLAALSALATSIPTVERTGEPALISMSAALDIDRARALLPLAADVLSQLSESCQVPDLGRGLRALASTSWPPYLRGIQGASVVITAMDEATSKFEGSAVLHVADPQQLLAAATSSLGLPAFGVQPDGRAVEILHGLAPMPIHLAMNQRSLAVGVGPGGDTAAEVALGGAVEPAPLFRMTLDYAQYGKMPLDGDDAFASAFQMFGEGTFELAVGDRGLVGLFNVELQ